MAELNAAEGGTSHPRPLSPHLTVYRWTLTMAMSIVHRATGIALYAGTLLLAWWLIALSLDAGSYVSVASFMGSVLGRVILFGFTWALLHHMLGGIRHFVWDLGYAFDHPEREWITQANVVASIVLTILVWLIAAFVV